jgi:aldose 1-epimerase
VHPDAAPAPDSPTPDATGAAAGEPLGTTPAGEPVTAHTLARDDLRVRILSYGAIVQSLEVGGVNVALGFADLATYIAGNDPYFGAVVGRYANRIAGGRFTLGGREHVLARNDEPNALHGGEEGFDRRVWEVAEAAGDRLVLRRISPDGEEGYPGSLEVEVAYALVGDGTVRIDYTATCDAPTVVNLTQHSSFNLAGEGSGDVYGHELELPASRFAAVDATAIPLPGEPPPVDGTAFDFRTPTPIGARIRDAEEQLLRGQGYDHHFVLDRDGIADGELALAARLRDPGSGRTLEVHTTEPGVQFYSGNFLDATLVGPGGRPTARATASRWRPSTRRTRRTGPDFPSVVLEPGATYRSRTEWRFS